MGSITVTSTVAAAEKPTQLATPLVGYRENRIRSRRSIAANKILAKGLRSVNVDDPARVGMKHDATFTIVYFTIG